MISVEVINNLDTNGTSIHWHGIRQLNSNVSLLIGTLQQPI